MIQSPEKFMKTLDPCISHPPARRYNLETKTLVSTLSNKVTPFECIIIDDAFPSSFIDELNKLRERLQLDLKRPTCPRRFFKECRGNSNLQMATEDGWVGCTLTTFFQQYSMPFHVFPFFRFLEYKPGGSMAKHTDGTNAHTIGDQVIKSTHTMLLYLNDCDGGGETCIWKLKDKKDKKKRKNGRKQAEGGGGDDDDIIERVSCKQNRILIFPHQTPHEGCLVEEGAQKICLRAELYYYDNEHYRYNQVSHYEI